MFDYGATQVVWNQRNWGTNPEPGYPWGATLYGDRGTLKISVRSYDFIPKGKGRKPVSGKFLDERSEYPEDKAHRETEPAADIEEGYISTACCILANLSMRLGRSLA